MFTNKDKNQYSFADIVKRHNDSRIEVLKIDIEGKYINHKLGFLYPLQLLLFEFFISMKYSPVSEWVARRRRQAPRPTEGF